MLVVNTIDDIKVQCLMGEIVEFSLNSSRTREDFFKDCLKYLRRCRESTLVLVTNYIIGTILLI